MEHNLYLKEAETALPDLLIDSGMIMGEPKTDLGKMSEELHLRLEHIPKTVDKQQYIELVNHRDSAIKFPKRHIAHVVGVASMYKHFVRILHEIESEDAEHFPDPDTAFTHGLLHDLSSVYSNYAAGKQETKELDAHLLSLARGWTTSAKIFMHSDYRGIAQGIATHGVSVLHPDVREKYQGWESVLQGHGAYRNSEVQRMADEVENTLASRVLSAIDFAQFEYDSSITPNTFSTRAMKGCADLMRRYYYDPEKKGHHIPVLGVALKNGGLQRIQTYLSEAQEIVQPYFNKWGRLLDEAL